MSHHVHDEYLPAAFIVAMDYATWWLHGLPITRVWKLEKRRPAVGMAFKLIHVAEHALDQLSSRLRIVE